MTNDEIISNVITTIEIAGPLSNVDLLDKMDEFNVGPHLDATRHTRLNRLHNHLRDELKRPMSRLVRDASSRYTVRNGLAKPPELEFPPTKKSPGNVKKTKKLTSVAPMETIRNRLGLNMSQFSDALGYSDGAYSMMAREGQAPQTAALAAEALMRRQNSTNDVIFLVKISKGIAKATPIDTTKCMTLDGIKYLLVLEP